jgi:hypothetical protein
MSEKHLQELEQLFPTLSGNAFMDACKRLLASGQSVLQSEQGVIYEVFPDGRRRTIKKIEPPTPVQRGCKIEIK